jgi:hypothetical protein
MRTRAAVLSFLLIAGAMSACGGDESKSNADRYSGEKAKVAAVVDQLGEAARSGDGDRICDKLFDSNLKTSVTRASNRPCSQEVVDKTFDEKTRYDVQSLGLAGDRAQVRVKDEKDRTSLLLILREGGSWRIARIS